MHPGHHRSDTRSLRFLVALVLGVAAALTGCYAPPDEDAPGAGAGERGDTEGAEAGSVALAFAERGDHGEILVDGQGRTLYVFTNDEPGTSNCYEQCAVNWPPLLGSEVVEAPEAISDRIGVTDRADGNSQVTYDGLPLYHFIGDEGPNDTTGDGVNGVWFVVRHPPANSDMLDIPGDHAVATSNVQYHPDTTGFLAVPDNVPDAPGVVMVHEWWGLNDNIRNMAELLATHGYRVLAVDLFEGNVATTASEAQQQVQALDQDEANANMQAAADHLRGLGAPGIVSLGWCFGGGQSLQLALSGEDLEATVIYYGFLVTDETQLGAIDWPVLGIFGEDDQAIPVSNVRAFESALDNLSVQSQIYVYPDVGHAFANPSGDAWAPDQTADAWQRTLDFLKTHANG